MTIHGQAKKVTWGVSSQGAMSKICRPPSAAGKFFTWGASSLGTFAIFKLSAPILEGGGTHFTLGSVHFWPFLLRELQGGVKKFSAALPRRHPRVAPPTLFFYFGSRPKNFFYPGVHPIAHVWSASKYLAAKITYFPIACNLVVQFFSKWMRNIQTHKREEEAVLLLRMC